MNIISEIDYNIIDDYISKFKVIKSDFTKELFDYAIINNVPIIKDDVASFLKNIIKIKQPKKILEIGTAIGYSAILIAETLNGNCQIDTIEKNINMFEIAQKNIQRTNYEINVIFGDAIQEISRLNNKYDLVFIDAAKGHYREFFDLVYPKLNSNATIISDNMLHKGLVCLPLESVPRRQRTIVRNMNSFIDYVYSKSEIITSIIPIGDGLMINTFV